jgi:hypothetical protein
MALRLGNEEISIKIYDRSLVPLISVFCVFNRVYPVSTLT